MRALRVANQKIRINFATVIDQPIILFDGICNLCNRSIIGTYAAPAPDMEVLKSFYKNVQPWGFWKPVHDAVMTEDPTWQTEANFKADMSNVVLGIIAQCCLTLLPMYLILSMFTDMAIVGTVLLVIGIILKRTWWDKLQTKLA